MEEALELEFDPDLNPTPLAMRGPKALVAAALMLAADDIDKAVAVYRVLVKQSKPRPKRSTILTSIHNGISADDWVESNRTDPYSFLWCCDTLEMNAVYVRQQLLLAPQMREVLEKHYERLASEGENPGPLRPWLITPEPLTKKQLAGRARSAAKAAEREAAKLRAQIEEKTHHPSVMYAEHEQRTLFSFLYPLPTTQETVDA